MKSKSVRNEGGARIERIMEPIEGILVFDQNLRPLFCSKTIKPLCLQICKSGTCVLERQGKETPELFSIIHRFRRDCDRLPQPGSPHAGGELVPDSIVYLSSDGNFTIRCIRLDKKVSWRGKALLQVSLLRAIALTNFNMEIIDRKFGLTAAELSVLKLTIGGSSSAETANRLLVSNATIKVHLRHIYKKLGIVRRSQILSKLI